MFTHGKTGKKYFSIREKLNYYKKKARSTDSTPGQVKYAKARIESLSKLNDRTFDEPEFIVVDDKSFGNAISKPRLGVVFDKDNKGHLLVASVNNRSTKAIILDQDCERQVDERKAWIDVSNVYDTNYIDDVQPLTEYDKHKIISILRKK